MLEVNKITSSNLLNWMNLPQRYWKQNSLSGLSFRNSKDYDAQVARNYNFKLTVNLSIASFIL